MMLALNAAEILTQWVWPIAQFIIGLGLVVFVHELGHFLCAKWARIKVEEFALGFGKRIWGFRVGETDYRLNVLPLGGYVKMLGQDDFKPETTELADARSWNNTPVHKRFIVLAAGVVMNVIFGALVFVIVYLVGIRFVAPVVGGVVPDKPAAKVELPKDVALALGQDQAVGLAPGDRILAINGTKVRKFEQIMHASILSREGESFTFTVERQTQGSPVVFNVKMVPAMSDDLEEGSHFIFGIAQPPSTTITEPSAFGYADKTAFKRGDRILTVNGTPLEHLWDIQPLLKEPTGQPVTFTVQRGTGQVDVPVQSFLITLDSKNLLDILGMAPRVLVGAVLPRSPAEKAKLQSGDLIVDYGDIGAPSQTQLRNANKFFVAHETNISVLRDGKTVNLTVVPELHEGQNEEGKPEKQVLIGFRPLPEQQTAYVAEVAADSPAARAGIEPGAILTAVNDTPTSGWPEVFNALKAARGQELTISYTFGAEQRRAHFGVLTDKEFDPEMSRYEPVALDWSQMDSLLTPPVRGNPAEALAWSARDTVDFVATTYQTIAALISGRVSPKAASGPVGIGNIAVQVARRDLMTFAYFMAMLSVMVAVFNFLPLPALDGGHALLLLIEKIRGRPLPLKVQAGFQIAGLVLIFGLLLAVTWNDIARILPKW